MLGPLTKTGKVSLGIFDRLAWHVGTAMRESGLALERLGASIQGDMAHDDEVPRHRRLMPVYNLSPKVSADNFIAPSASLVGDVRLDPGASVWYGAVVRGDTASCRVGLGAVVGERAVVTPALEDPYGTGAARPDGDVGRPGRVTVGANAFVHPGARLSGCTVSDGAHVCANATVLDGAVVGAGARVEAGAVVAAGCVVGDNEVWAGVPAAKVRMVTEAEAARMKEQVSQAGRLASGHSMEAGKTWEQVRSDVAGRLREAARDPDFDAHIGLAQRMARERETPSRYH